MVHLAMPTNTTPRRPSNSHPTANPSYYVPVFIRLPILHIEDPDEKTPGYYQQCHHFGFGNPWHAPRVNRFKTSRTILCGRFQNDCATNRSDELITNSEHRRRFVQRLVSRCQNPGYFIVSPKPGEVVRRLERF